MSVAPEVLADAVVVVLGLRLSWRSCSCVCVCVRVQHLSLCASLRRVGSVSAGVRRECSAGCSSLGRAQQCVVAGELCASSLRCVCVCACVYTNDSRRCGADTNREALAHVYVRVCVCVYVCASALVFPMCKNRYGAVARY